MGEPARPHGRMDRGRQQRRSEPHLGERDVGGNVEPAGVAAGYELDDSVIEAARVHGVRGRTAPRSPRRRLDADAVFTDVWVSMGQEGEGGDASTPSRDTASTTPDEARESRMRLPPLPPGHRGIEVSASVIDGPASAVWDQAENRLHSARGLLLWLVARGCSHRSETRS